MRKYKMTGCARFFIFLIIFVPALYFGVSYYNGEDGWQNIKDMIGIESSDSAPDRGDTKELSSLEKELDDRDRIIRSLNDRIESLEKQVEQKDLEIQNLKQQLGQ